MAAAKPESELPRMAVSLAHTIIRGNIFAGIRYGLCGSGFHAYVAGAVIKASNVFAAPDVVVANGRPDLTMSLITEPALVAEVNPPWTEEDDTPRKWQGYCLIPSLQHYMIVAQAIPFITLHTRTGAFSWTEQVYLDGTIELTALGVSLAFDEIYDGIAFEPRAGDA